MIKVLWTLFELVVTVFESSVISFFICSFMGLNLKEPKGRITCITGGLVFSALVVLINQLTIYEGIYGIIYSIEYFLFALFFLKGSILRKLFVSILANIVVVGVNAFVTSSLSAALGSEIEKIYSEQSLIRFVLMIIVQALYVYVFGLILKITTNKEMALRGREWMLIISVLGASFVSLIFIHMTQVNIEPTAKTTTMLFVSELGIIVVNIVCFYMTTALSVRNRETMAMKTQQQQQEYRIQYAENVQQQYEETRRLRHDMKQHIATLYALHKDGNYSEAEKLLQKYEQNLKQMDIIIDVGNNIINAILNYKINLAQEKNIEVLISSSKNISGIDETDLCTLLGNILDNAIEACEKCSYQNRSITCNINEDASKIVISVANSIESSVIKRNEQLDTTKIDKTKHGFGVKTIKAIAAKYSGNVDYYEEKNMFVCKVIMFK